MTRVRGLRQRFSIQLHWRIALGLTIVLIVLAAALLAPLCTPDSKVCRLDSPYHQQLELRRQLPSRVHLFGLDELGRDNLSRVVHGASQSLYVGLGSVGLAVVGGMLIGLAAGYFGGWEDSILMALMDILLAFPSLLMALAIVAAIGRGLNSVLYALAIAALPVYARLIRVSVVTIKQREYVLAANAIGVPLLRLLWRHILPNCLTAIAAQTTLGIGTAMLEAAGLSFLGLGALSPTPEWGAMIAQGRGAIFSAPHIVLFPALAIIITVLGINLLGEGLQQMADPRQERRWNNG